MDKTERYYVIEADWGSGFRMSYASTSKDKTEKEFSKREARDLPCKMRMVEKDYPKDAEERFDAAVQLLAEDGLIIDDVGYGENAFRIHIEWGDWKHAHLRSDYIMDCLGFDFAGEAVTDSDMSDTYSAWRCYEPKQKGA